MDPLGPAFADSIRGIKLLLPAYVKWNEIRNVLTDKWSFLTEFANFEVKIITGQNFLFKRHNCLFTSLLNEDVVASKNWWTEVTFAGQMWLLLDRSDILFLEMTELSFSAKLLVRSVVKRNLMNFLKYSSFFFCWENDTSDH